MTDQLIPEAAVIEGARAISGVDFSAYPDPSFRIARAILEAAAPHMGVFCCPLE